MTELVGAVLGVLVGLVLGIVEDVAGALGRAVRSARRVWRMWHDGLAT